MNLFEYSLQLKGFPIKKAKNILRDIQDIPEDCYLDYITKKREEIVHHHLQNSPLYQHIYGSERNLAWEEIPVMTKADLQKPIVDRLSYGFKKNNVYINKTSGSSGHPFVFAKDKLCHALTWAEIMDRFSWHGLDFHNDLQARFYGIPLETFGYWKERFKDFLSSRYRLPIFDLSDEKLDGFLKVFKKKPFAFINGYTSSIVAFAKYVRSRGVILTDICPTLRCCVVTSEILFEDDRKLMEEVFGVPVVNEYGASELDLIAFEDKAANFVVNSETLFVEVLSEEGRVLPHGTPGRIVITSLYNQAHPMIRYDLGDTGILDPEGTLKTPILKKLIGRTNDFAILPDGKQVPGLTFYYVTKSAISDSGNIREFVIEQTSPAKFIVRYVSDNELTASDLKSIKKALQKYVGDQLELIFERKSVLRRTARGKLMQFSRSF